MKAHLPVQPFMPRLGWRFRTVIRANFCANNRRLAQLIRCSPALASRCVAQLDGAIRRARNGREVLISPN